MLLATACALGLVLAVAALMEMYQHSGSGAGFALLFATTWLALFGTAALVSGGLALVLANDSSTPWHKRRCWIAVLLGLLVAAIGLYFGVPFG